MPLPPPLVMSITRRLTLLAALVRAVLPGDMSAQNVDYVSQSLLQQVMPEADRFSPAGGDPVVKEAYRGEDLIGYVFLTSDLPPERYGYSGPIEALVGMTLDGTLTGARVTDYRESYMLSRGDFLRTPGFQEQYAGKYIAEPFHVGRDIAGISGVSISVRAFSRGVRDTARRVASAFSGAVPPTGPVADVVNLSWFEMRRRGVVERMDVTKGEGSAAIVIAHISSDRVGEYLLGEYLYELALEAVERRGGTGHLMLYGVGGRLRLFVREGWSIEQGGDTITIPPRNIVLLGLPRAGLVYGEATLVGIMMIDDTVDIAKPFSFLYDLGPEFGSYSLAYTTQEARIVMVEDAAAAEAAAAEAEAEDAAARAAAAGTATGELRELDEPESVEAGVTPAVSLPPETPAADLPAVGAQSASAGQIERLDFTLVQEETLLERMLSSASWTRVALVVLVLAFGTAAFFTKATALRWISLGVTLVVLGFVDGGFLSISHITSGIWVGPSVFLADLPLLLMVVFTVVTTLVWGRVFCGFLCPFGALQDFLDRIVPRRWQRTPSKRAHEAGLKAKYGVLAIIVIPALAGSQASLYQYFEPFGTVFSLSSSVLLWTIAGAVIVASAIVPRFYCRYACPLGAALAIGSLISLRRIRRVEHCDYCKVCEQRCPTGAIEGSEIDFKECVRCNVCEVQLIEQTGVCGHDMEEIRPRLVRLKIGALAGAVDGR